MIAFIITIILIAVILVYWYLQQHMYFYKNIISFKDSLDLVNLPVITMYAGKKKVNLLLDSGSSECLLDESILESIIYTENEVDSVPMMGIDGNITYHKSIQTILTYSQLKFNVNFVTGDFSQAFNNVKSESGVTIHGILGVDFFTRNNYILDFDKLMFYKK